MKTILETKKYLTSNYSEQLEVLNNCSLTKKKFKKSKVARSYRLKTVSNIHCKVFEQITNKQETDLVAGKIKKDRRLTVQFENKQKITMYCIISTKSF